MKLAEALQERADIKRNLTGLRERLARVALVQEGEKPAEDPTELNKTVHSQPAIMACSLCAFEALKEKGVKFDGVAGHSLGEYAAMVAAEVVSLEDGFKLIKARAAAMQKAAESASGAMYAIIGLDAAEVEKVCEETEGYVVPVNYNSSVQTVIAGETAACEAAAAKFAEMKKRAIKFYGAISFTFRQVPVLSTGPIIITIIVLFTFIFCIIDN